MERISSGVIKTREVENYQLLLENYRAKIKLLNENREAKNFIKRTIYLLKLGKDFFPCEQNNYAQAVEMLYQDTKKSCETIFTDDKSANYSTEKLVQSIGSRAAFLFAFMLYSMTKEFSYEPFEVPILYEFKEKNLLVPPWSVADYALKFAENNQQSTMHYEQLKELLRTYLIAMAYIHSMKASNSSQIKQELKTPLTTIEIKINYLKKSHAHTLHYNVRSRHDNKQKNYGTMAFNGSFFWINRRLYFFLEILLSKHCKTSRKN